MNKILFSVVPGLLVLLCPALARGQAVYGYIVGTVTDSSGAAVPSAKVTILDAGKGVSFSASTNIAGNYAQQHLIVGTYEVRIEAPGFTTFVQRNVNVEVDTGETGTDGGSKGSKGSKDRRGQPELTPSRIPKTSLATFSN